MGFDVGVCLQTKGLGHSLAGKLPHGAACPYRTSEIFFARARMSGYTLLASMERSRIGLLPGSAQAADGQGVCDPFTIPDVFVVTGGDDRVYDSGTEQGVTVLSGGADGFIVQPA